MARLQVTLERLHELDVTRTCRNLDASVMGARTGWVNAANSTPPAVIVRVGTFFHVTFRFCDALMIPSLRR